MSPTAAEKRHYQFDQFRVDPFRRLLLRDSEVVPVTPKVFSILLVLLERRGEVVEKKELLEQVWPDTAVTEANLTQNVSSLRKALGERASERRYVVTLPGRGYSFVGDVLEVPVETFALEPASPPAAAPEPEAGLEPSPAPSSAAVREPAFETSAEPAAVPSADRGILSDPEPIPLVRERPRLLATVLGILLLIATVVSALYFSQAPGI
ncbi:MAG TPA: transcriptional regulator, partial [Thermoanaerobaculia bacterium]|nr:transcriptional regulator [Thermoanaerobaculia bacterium]